MCNVQHLVTNHTESQVSQERRAALPSPFTGGWLHMCSFRKMHYSLTSCQLYFLVTLSSFLAHLLALSHRYYIIYIFRSTYFQFSCTFFLQILVNCKKKICSLLNHGHRRTIIKWLYHLDFVCALGSAVHILFYFIF